MLVAQIIDGNLELGKMFNSSNGDIKKYAGVIQKFKAIENISDYIDINNETNWSAIAEVIGDCDDTALSYFKTLDDGNGTINNQAASMEGLSKHLEKTGNGFASAAVKTTLLNSALNAGIFLAVSLAIQAISTGIDNYIHRVENARERTAELLDEFQQRNLP